VDSRQLLECLLGKLELRQRSRPIFLEDFKKTSLCLDSLKARIEFAHFIDSDRLFIAFKDSDSLNYLVLDVKKAESVGTYAEKNPHLQISNMLVSKVST